MKQRYVLFTYPKNVILNNFVTRFFEKFEMPGVIGHVDGTHISIKRPKFDVEHVYYAVRKSAHTKNVQVVSSLNFRQGAQYFMFLILNRYAMLICG